MYTVGQCLCISVSVYGIWIFVLTQWHLRPVGPSRSALDPLFGEHLGVVLSICVCLPESSHALETSSGAMDRRSHQVQSGACVLHGMAPPLAAPCRCEAANYHTVPGSYSPFQHLVVVVVVVVVVV